MPITTATPWQLASLLCVEHQSSPVAPLWPIPLEVWGLRFILFILTSCKMISITPLQSDKENAFSLKSVGAFCWHLCNPVPYGQTKMKRGL